MTKEPLIKLPIDTPSESFKTHLEGNERILFSAPFGTGKTYFLKHFFEYPDMAEKYNVFHLFPVNYQVASNEDIFELVKYDLLLNMLLKGSIDAQSDDIPKSLAVQSYLMAKSPVLLTKMLKCIPFSHIDSAAKASEKVTKFFSDFGKYYSEINKGDFDAVCYFVEQMTAKKGSIYEMDAISNLIYDTLQVQKKENGEKENVLIIDDLDRVDPEHIFRLLNVFSAHFDLPTEEENKFGFDKVIFVCDVKNVRNIFATKYGQYTDFSGYIDKFYSSTIYEFDNVQAAVEILERWEYYGRPNSQMPLAKAVMMETFGATLISCFFQSKCINLRQFTVLNSINIGMLSVYNTKKRQINYAYPRELILLDVIYILLVIYGGSKQRLIMACVQASTIETGMGIRESFLKHLLPILKINELNDLQKPFIYINEELDMNISFTIKKESFDADLCLKASEVKTQTGNPIFPLKMKEVVLLLKDAVEVMDKQGLI